MYDNISFVAKAYIVFYFRLYSLQAFFCKTPFESDIMSTLYILKVLALDKDLWMAIASAVQIEISTESLAT